MKKKIVILGSGFIAKNLAKNYKKDFKILILGRSKKKGIKFFFDKFGKYKNIDLKKKLPKMIFKSDVIINTMGTGNFFFAQEKKQKHLLNIINLYISLLEQLKHFKGKIFFFSSYTASLNSKQLKHSFYAVSQNLLENIIYAFQAKHNLKYSIFRLPSVIGPYNNKQLFWDIMRKFSNNKRKYVFLGDGKELRNYCDVKDLSNTIKKYINRKHYKNSIYQLYTKQNLSIKNIINIFSKKLNISFKKICFQRKCNFIPRKIILDKKIKKILIKNTLPIETSISNYIKWFKDKKTN